MGIKSVKLCKKETNALQLLKMSGYEIHRSNYAEVQFSNISLAE